VLLFESGATTRTSPDRLSGALSRKRPVLGTVLELTVLQLELSAGANWS
jgi:hypothetical protein